MSLAKQDLDLSKGEAAWKSLYRVGGLAALVAVIVFRRNIGAELWAFNGFGIFSIPDPLPASAQEWFVLLQRDAFVGMALLEVFDLVNYALVALIFLALYGALRRVSKSAMLLVAISALMGEVVYLASNQAFPILALSESYTAATSEAQRCFGWSIGIGKMYTSFRSTKRAVWRTLALPAHQTSCWWPAAGISFASTVTTGMKSRLSPVVVRPP